MSNNPAVDEVLSLIGSTVDKVGLADSFRRPYNVLDHKLGLNGRRVVVQLPMLIDLTEDHYAWFVQELNKIDSFEVLDVKKWSPTGSYLGFLNIKVAMPIRTRHQGQTEAH